MEIRRRLMFGGVSPMIGQFSKYAQLTQVLSDKANAVIANPLGIVPKLVIIKCVDGGGTNKTRYCVATDVCVGYRYTTGSAGTGASGIPVDSPEDVVAGRYYFSADQLVIGCANTLRAWTGLEYTIDIYA